VADQLPAIALALIAGTLAAGGDFSHKLHLQLLRDCSVCHAAARQSTKLEDNLLPRPAVCQPCHKGMTMKSKPPRNMLARFNHSAHVKIVPGECRGCHKESGETIALPKMQQCLVCHTKIEPTDSCALCHILGPHLKPASHTPEWGDLHSDAKIEKSGCWVCHGKRFTCQGCH
jgi:hypothetical protein